MSDTLTDMGHNVHIVTYPIGQEDIRVRRRQRSIEPAPFRQEHNAKVGPSPDKFVLDFQLLRLLCRVIREEQIDIIHAHNYEGALVGIMAKWLTGRPLLYNAVNLMSDELAGYRFIRPAFLAHGVARALDWFIPIFPNHITAVSPELRDWFLEHGVPASKVDMVPAGIEPEMFDHPEPEKFRQQYQLNGRPVVMYTGVLNAFQRVDYLLRAFAVALQAKPDALLLIVSPLVNATNEKEHKALADQLGISRSIIWIAPHALADLPSYLALADVTVVPRPGVSRPPGQAVELHAGRQTGRFLRRRRQGRAPSARRFHCSESRLRSARPRDRHLVAGQGARRGIGRQRPRHRAGRFRLAADLPQDRADLRSASRDPGAVTVRHVPHLDESPAPAAVEH